MIVVETLRWNKPGELCYEWQARIEWISLLHCHGNMLSDRLAVMQYANHLQWTLSFHLHSKYHRTEHATEPNLPIQQFTKRCINKIQNRKTNSRNTICKISSQCPRWQDSPLASWFLRWPNEEMTKPYKCIFHLIYIHFLVFVTLFHSHSLFVSSCKMLIGNSSEYFVHSSPRSFMFPNLIFCIS